MDQTHDMSDGNINISDVMEVITADPVFMDNGKEDQRPLEIAGSRPRDPYVEIIEQPASKALRFRYECEGRSAGSIPGVNSTPENKTFPTIRIVGYKGRAQVIVSCVTKDPPYRPHPHNLVGRDVCKQGVCMVEVSSDNMTATFANLGIQCVKKKDIEEALRIRESLRVDPFKTGFEHKKQPTSIDLNAVRLCFHVFIQRKYKGKFNCALEPVVSDPIYDKKAMSDLVICKLSHCSASVAGGMDMILLCEKVAKEDIQVRFFEEKDGQVVWEGYGEFQPNDVHRQTAIPFKTPTYRIQQIEQPVAVYIQLKRPSDGATSEALPFEMLPLGAGDPDSLRRKRQKFNNSSNPVLRHVQAETEKHGPSIVNYSFLPEFNIIKPEPEERAMASSYGHPVASGDTLSMYAVGINSPQSQAAGQSWRPHVSPHRTPSPKDCQPSPYNPNFVQQLSPQFPSSNHDTQLSVNIQQSPEYTFMHNPTLMASQLSPVYPSMNNQFVQQPPTSSCPQYPTSYLDDAANLQCGPETTMSQFFVTHPSNSLSLDPEDLDGILNNALLISDSKMEASGRMDVEASNAEDNGNMTDSVTRMAKNTIQELCKLNNMYKLPDKD